MRLNQGAFSVVVALTLVVFVLLARQHHETMELRSQIEKSREEAIERARLTAETRKLAASQRSAEELERLRAERNAVSALRMEIAAMKRRSETFIRPSALQGGSSAEVKPVAPSLKDSAFPVPANQWRNRGAATPEAAFETALWAAAGGDLEALTGLMVFDGEARAKTEAIFAKLPAGLQQELVSPQRLFALLVAKDVPLGSAKIWAQYGDAADTKIVAQVIDSREKSKQVRLSLRTEGENWRFVVPPSAVDKYAAQLQAPVATQ